MATRDHPGRPWEQQDGLEVAIYGILVDFGVISGPVSVHFSNPKCFHVFFYACFYVIFLAIVDLHFRHLRLQNHRFRIEGIAKSGFSWKLFFVNSRMDF